MILTVRSHAKINLYLDVLRKRRDGYHSIETVFQTISLADSLTFRPRRDDRIAITCNMPELGCGEDNLVYRAASRLRDAAGRALGVDVAIEKRIPMGAGLAGGSGNAAATLAALNGLWGLRLSRLDLHRMARGLGSDVPYCLEGGTMAATGRGEILAPLPALPETWLVVAHPPVHVSTRVIYNHPLLGHSAERPFAGRTRSFRAAIRALEAGRFQQGVFNRMETPVFAAHPELARLKQTFLDAGCLAAAMSGSGSSVFGVCGSRKEAEAVAGRVTGCPSCVAHAVNRALDIEHT